MTLKENLSSLLRDTYNELKNTTHKDAYSYNMGGNMFACVSDKLELGNNSIIIGGVYDWKHAKKLHDKMIDTIKSYLPTATLFIHNRAKYPYVENWEEFSVNGKLVVSVLWKYGHAYSIVMFE